MYSPRPEPWHSKNCLTVPYLHIWQIGNNIIVTVSHISGHLMNVISIFTLLLALFSVSTNS